MQDFRQEVFELGVSHFIDDLKTLGFGSMAEAHEKWVHFPWGAIQIDCERTVSACALVKRGYYGNLALLKHNEKYEEALKQHPQVVAAFAALQRKEESDSGSEMQFEAECQDVTNAISNLQQEMKKRHTIVVPNFPAVVSKQRMETAKVVDETLPCNKVFPLVQEHFQCGRQQRKVVSRKFQRFMSNAQEEMFENAEKDEHVGDFCDWVTKYAGFEHSNFLLCCDNELLYLEYAKEFCHLGVNAIRSMIFQAEDDRGEFCGVFGNSANPKRVKGGAIDATYYEWKNGDGEESFKDFVIIKREEAVEKGEIFQAKGLTEKEALKCKEDMNLLTTEIFNRGLDVKSGKKGETFGSFEKEDAENARVHKELMSMGFSAKVAEQRVRELAVEKRERILQKKETKEGDGLSGLPPPRGVQDCVVLGRPKMESIVFKVISNVVEGKGVFGYMTVFVKRTKKNAYFATVKHVGNKGEWIQGNAVVELEGIDGRRTARVALSPDYPDVVFLQIEMRAEEMPELQQKHTLQQGRCMLPNVGDNVLVLSREGLAISHSSGVVQSVGSNLWMTHNASVNNKGENGGQGKSGSMIFVQQGTGPFVPYGLHEGGNPDSQLAFRLPALMPNF